MAAETSNAQRGMRILLADEHALFREAMRVVLENQPDLTVVAEAGDGLQAISEAERVRPEVALLDTDLPNCNGVRATYLIKERVPECRILVLATQEDQATLIAALEAGATGYLTKDRPLAELIEAARDVYRGETRIPRGMLGALLSRLIVRRREHDVALRRTAQLTRREKEVLALLADGADKHAIAQALVISPQTARTHIQNVLAKLRVHSRLEAVALVRRNGILEDLVVKSDA